METVTNFPYNEVFVKIATDKWKKGLKQFKGEFDAEVFAEYTWQCFKHFATAEVVVGEQLSKQIGFKQSDGQKAIEAYELVHSKFINFFTQLGVMAQSGNEDAIRQTVAQFQKFDAMNSNFNLD